MTPKIANRMKALVLEQDRAQMQKTIDTLRYELSHRHTMAREYAELVKEKNILEDLVVSTQSENERCEEELKKWKAYAKDLEKKIEAYEGPNWQASPDGPTVRRRKLTSIVRQEGGGVPSTPAAIKAFRKPIGGQNEATRRIPQPAFHQATDALSKAVADKSSEATSTVLPETSRQMLHSACSQHGYPPETPQRRRRMARIGPPPEPAQTQAVNHEEQVVPALANASKREERRRSLLVDGASVRAGWTEMGLEMDGSKNTKSNESPKVLSVKASNQDGETTDAAIPDLGSMENLVSESPSSEEPRTDRKLDNDRVLAASLLPSRVAGCQRPGSQIARQQSLEEFETDGLALEKADGPRLDPETASVDSWYDENAAGWFDDTDGEVEDFLERLSCSSPEERERTAQELAREMTNSRNFQDPHQVAIVLKNFHIRFRGITSALESTLYQAQNTQREEQSKTLNMMRVQGEKHAEAIQQISDMADDVKAHVTEMEVQADEREKRLTEMLETALAHVELYSPPLTGDIQPSVNSTDINMTHKLPARITA